MHTKCVLLVNGQPVAGVFWEKLLRITINDREGIKSDTIDIQLEDGPPHLAIPEANDEIQCWLGYTNGAFDYMGRFKIDDVEIECFPWRLHIKGKAADMRETLKQHRRRHWDGKTFGNVVEQMAGEHGLTAQVDGEIGAFKPDGDWFGQENESDLHFVERWSQKLDGLFTVKDGKLIVSKRGSGLTPGGASMGELVITPPDHIKGSCKVFKGQREKHKKSRSEYHDTKTGKRQHEDADGDSSASSTYNIRHHASGKAEAKASARARAKYLKRGGERTSVDLVGNPFAKAGLPMRYAGFRPGVDGTVYIIEEAVHTYTKGGAYRTQVRGKIKDEQGSGGGGGGAEGAGAEGAGQTDAQAQYPPDGA